MGNMRRTLRNVAIAAALPTFANAVALSDMTPRAMNLPYACYDLYTAQIAGCTPSDWTSTQCSTACQNALLVLVGPINKACGNQGIQGQNLVVAFLAGVGPQQLCHNIPKEGEATTAAPTTTTTATPSIISDSTSTAESVTETKSLIADTTSSSSKSTTTKTSTSSKHTTADEVSSSMAYTSSEAAATTTRTNRPTSSPSRTTSSEGSSQTDFDQSGGGSPFDSPGNLINAASGLSLSALSLALPAFVAVLFTTLR